MLIVRVFVNLDRIDEIHIQRGKPVYHHGDLFYYHVRRPTKFRDIVVEHKKSKGYRELLLKVLQKMVGEEPLEKNIVYENKK